MECPACKAKIHPPRQAYFSAGVRVLVCPNGHKLTVTTSFKPK